MSWKAFFLGIVVIVILDIIVTKVLDAWVMVARINRGRIGDP